MGHLYALDFDGILCDSCGESAISALKTAKIRYPELFAGVDTATETWILDSMRIIREGREPGSVDEIGKEIAKVMLVVQVCPTGVPEGRASEEYKQMAKVLVEAATSSSPRLPLTALLVQDFHDSGDSVNEPVAHIYDYIGISKFRISPTAFFQVNSVGAKKLYSLAGDWAGLGPDTLLFDVCCGTGAIGLTLAKRVGMVVGIEMNASAIADAQLKADLNGIKNCRFICGKAEDVISNLLNEYAIDVLGDGEKNSEPEVRKDGEGSQGQVTTAADNAS